MDRSLVAGAILLLFLEIGLLFAGLDDVPVWKRGLDADSRQQRPIAFMKRTESHVRRRPRASLVWEESRPSDTLYEADSVLTLSGSTAQIEFHSNTTLNIDENTLVVLEESPHQSDGSLRVRFSRGTLRSSNPSQPMRIESGEWSLAAEQGSVVNLVSLNDGRYDIEIQAGRVKLQSGVGNELEVGGGERLIIRSDGVEDRKIVDAQLSWDEKLPSRLYAREFPVETVLKWQGQAEKILLIRPDKSAEAIPIERTKSSLQLRLQPGTYLVSLVNGNRVSESRTLQVREAPLFRYFSPLPRNRIQSGVETLFSWEPNLFASQYRLEISRDPKFSSSVIALTAEKPALATTLESEGAYYWRVIGLDEEKTPIPEPRVYPLFVIPDPLQSPELQTPTLRRPATPEETPRAGKRKSSFLWHVFFSTAWAKKRTPSSDSDFEAVFTWTSVPGADHYIIEISESPGFEEPIVIERVKTPQFVWRNFKKGRYFWRVAAGQSGPTGDRLGLFSPIAVAHLEDFEKNAGPGVTLARKTSFSSAKETATTPKPDLEEKFPEELMQVIPETEPVPQEPSSWRRILTWAPSHRSVSMEGENDIHGSFSGLSPLAFEGEIRFITNKRFWSLRLTYDETYWDPRRDSAPPSQSSVREQRFSGELVAGQSSSYWSFGFGAESFPIFKRKAPDEGALESVTVFGPSARFNYGGFDFYLSARFGEILGGRGRAGRHFTLIQSERAIYSAFPFYSYGQFQNSESKIVDQGFGLSLSMEW